MTLKALLQYWPIIAAVASGIWWAATENAKLEAVQTYITRTAQHVDNLDYNLTVGNAQ